MENSQPSLATDSFSYSWLVNPRPNSMDEIPSSIDSCGENDPRLTHNNFSFDVSISSDDFDDHLTSLPLVHADKLFSNGRLMPAFPTTPSTHSFATTSNQISPTSSSSPSFETSVSVSASLIGRHHQQSIFPRKFSRFSRKFLHKYLGFLLPSCPIGSGPRRRRCKRVDDLDRRAQEVKSLNNTPETVSPRMSTASAYSNWSDYADTSIYEAILYCKKSSEQ